MNSKSTINSKSIFENWPIKKTIFKTLGINPRKMTARNSEALNFLLFWGQKGTGGGRANWRSSKLVSDLPLLICRICQFCMKYICI